MATRLNREQSAAASHAGGHAIVLAGPGTGKTTTLVARHAFLRSRGKDFGSIMVATFTTAAAEELAARIGPGPGRGAWIGTFHSLSLRLLRRFHAEAGLMRSFAILDQPEQRRLIADLGIRWDSDDGDLTDIIGRWKDSMTAPADAATASAGAGPAMRSAAAHYAAYEEELSRRGALDFADLVARAGTLLESSGPARDFAAATFSDLLVDEFQDVNAAQARLLSALASLGANLWAVADDDQSLYGWRGADVRLTVRFPERFPGATSYVLVENYRCDPAVLAAAGTLIGHNRTRVAKTLRASKPHARGSNVRLNGLRTDRDEAAWIAADVASRIAAGTRPREVAVLFRTSSVAPQIQQALEQAAIPFSISGAGSFWDMPEVTAVADLLCEVEAGIPGAAADRSRAARDLVATMAGESPRSAAPAAGRLIADAPPAGSSSERAALWSDTASAVAAMAATHETAASFARFVTSMAARLALPADPDAVSLTTIHSAKGLEWNHVIVAGCEASMMPHHRSEDPEEERRLLYVALTRSRNDVTLTFVRTRFGRSQTPSPFVAELMKSPSGAVSWIGEESRPSQGGGGRNASQMIVMPADPPKVYRKRGARSLIPPDET